MGLPPEEIAAAYGLLGRAPVHAALAHYHANTDEIESDPAEEEIFADRVVREIDAPPIR
jgi:hypothetical protein